jgi:hypothetical protein
MAKTRKVKRTKKVVRKVARKVSVKPANNKRLSILMILLAIAIFVLAAMSMVKAGI